MDKTFETESLSNPIYQELVATLSNQSFPLPYVEKGKILISPGVWNQKLYTAEEIKKGFKNTDWEDRANRNLFFDHADEKAREWIGEVENIMCSDDGVLTGDLYYKDPIAAMKMYYGKPKTGVSAKVSGNDTGTEMQDFRYNNFSVVINPAVKTAWINNSDGNKPNYINQVNSEVNTMAEEIPTPVVDKPTEVLAETPKTETMSEELSEFVAFYNQEKVKNPECKIMEVCNAFVAAKKPIEEPIPEKKKEEPPIEEMSAKVEPKTDEMSDKSIEIDELKKSVATLSEVVKTLSDKLEEPERVAVKGVATSAVLSQKIDSDEAIMAYMKRM